MRAATAGPMRTASAAVAHAGSGRWLSSSASTRKKLQGKAEFDKEALNKALAMGSSSSGALSKTIADKPWVQLSPAQKATESVKTGFSGVVIAAGLGLAAACLYYVGKEAKESIFGKSDLGSEWREKALDRILANSRVTDTLGEDASMIRVGDTVEFDIDNGSTNCMRTSFLVGGSNGRKAIVTLEVYKSASTAYTWSERFLVVDVQANNLSPKFRIEVVKAAY